MADEKSVTSGTSLGHTSDTKSQNNKNLTQVSHLLKENAELKELLRQLRKQLLKQEGSEDLTESEASSNRLELFQEAAQLPPKGWIEGTTILPSWTKKMFIVCL